MLDLTTARSRMSMLLAFVLVLQACTQTNSPTDGGVTADSGISTDAGKTPDAGIDGGNDVDAGTHDGGSEVDAGLPDAGTDGGTSPVPVTSITVTAEGNATTLTGAGSTLQMHAAVLPTNATNPVVAWSVDLESVATISTTGLLTAIASGTVVVTARAQDDSNVSGSAIITVTVLVPVTNIAVSATGGVTSLAGAGHTVQMIATVLPANAADASVVWSVSSEAIASISASGLLTAIGDGSVVVTATAHDGSGVSGTATLAVTSACPSAETLLGGVCVPNSCATSHGACVSNAVCTPTGPGTNSCTCPTGFSGDGTSTGTGCVDDCTVGNGGCGAHSTCGHDAISSAITCTCNAGFAPVDGACVANNATSVEIVMAETACATDADWDVFVGGTVVQTITGDNSCGCDIPLTTVSITDPTALAALGAPGTCEEFVELRPHEAQNTYVFYARVNIVRAVTGAESICLADDLGLNCDPDRDLCQSEPRAYPAYSTPSDVDGNGAPDCAEGCPAGYTLQGMACVDSCTVDNGACGADSICSHDEATNEVLCFANACLTNNGGCDTNATCTPRPWDGSARCRCTDAYVGDGTSCFLDQCQINHGGCDANADCETESDGSAYCYCSGAYVGDGTTCYIDQCQIDNGGCTPDAYCSTQDNGSALCSCPYYYKGDGTVAGTGCSPINNCDTDNGGCDTNASCTYTGPATNTCACHTDFVGDGVTCAEATSFLSGPFDMTSAITGYPGSTIGAVGTVFQVTAPGVAVGVRVYHPDWPINATVGHLWDSNRQQLASIAIPAGPPGWAYGIFSTPVRLSAGTTYYVSNDVAGIRWEYIPGAFNQDVVAGPLFYPAAIYPHGNGLLGLTAGAFPDRELAGPFQGVDVLFRPDDVCLLACGANATCDTSNESVICSCPSGYSGDGSQAVGCTAINNCATNASGCDANASCTMTGPGTNSCACNTGYDGDGLTSGTGCQAIDNCARGLDGCIDSTTCVSTGPGTNTCGCPSGYEGDGTTAGSGCQPIDNCARGIGGCDTNATCTPTGPATNSCSCNTGYSGDGTTDGSGCQPIDNCASGIGGCDANATCAPTGPGTNSCTCNAGYVGSGASCLPPVRVTGGALPGEGSGVELNQGAAFEYGTVFVPSTAGQAVGVRYYRTPSMSAARTGHLWDMGGNLLAAVVLNGTDVGWQQAYLATPVELSPHTAYVVSIDSLDFIFFIDSGLLQTGISGAALSYPSASDVPNGRFALLPDYFPDYNGNGDYYYVDVLFAPTDPCLANNGGCGSYGTCDSSSGAPVCTCLTGYVMSGDQCVLSDACVAGVAACATNAACTNLGSGDYSCACPTGYDGDGVNSCTAIDNCANGTGGCSAQASCTYTGPGTNSCTCATGYSGDGTTAGSGCTAIDRCTNGTSGCDANADCTYTGPGTNTCACHGGYLGSGTWCALAGDVITGLGSTDPSTGQSTYTGMPFEFGVAFTTSAAGEVVGIRTYRSADMSAARTGHLWDSAGNLLAEVALPTELGWQNAYLSNAVTLTPGTTYIVSQGSPDGYDYRKWVGFASPVTVGPLSYLHGAWNYPAGSFPNQSQGYFYFVDVLFVEAPVCSCPATSCSDGMLTTYSSCDGSGTCNSGGTTAACAGGLNCADASTCLSGCGNDTDCASGFCNIVTTTCVANQCLDQRQDGMETDVDCGGTCSKCKNGLKCQVNSDCVSGACDFSTLKCVP